MSGPIGARAGERPVTARQFELLRIIESSLEQRGFPPTYRELTIELGLSLQSRQTIHEHLSRLVAKKMIVRHARAARGITLTAAARALLAAHRAARAAEQSVIGEQCNDRP